MRSSFFGGVGGAAAEDADDDDDDDEDEEVGEGESFGFSTLVDDARAIWFPARRRDCFCCLRVNEHVAVALNCLVKDCVANMVSLSKKARFQYNAEFCQKTGKNLHNGDTSAA